MPEVVFVHPDGRREHHDAPEGESIMRVATSNLVEGIIGECGGDLSCATCHVYLDEAWIDRVPERTPEEVDMLEAAADEPNERSRLACQIAVGRELDGIIVHLPEFQR